jgi:hypothetical protein
LLPLDDAKEGLDALEKKRLQNGSIVESTAPARDVTPPRCRHLAGLSALPFVAIMIVAVIMICIFPGIAMSLPKLLMG